VVFVNDADINPVADTVSRIHETYGNVLRTVLPNMEDLQANSILSRDGFSCGCLIFSDQDGAGGTLENIIEPMMRKQQPDRHASADAFVAKHASPQTVAGNTERPSKKLKAVLTIAGQIDFPSYGLSVIIRDSDALNWHHLKDDPRCAKCIQVLTGV